MHKRLVTSLFVAAAALHTAPALAGRIVLANDEWTLSNTGYVAPNDPGQFATNVGSLFSGGGAGNFLVFSNNFGLAGSMLASTMTTAGHSWTVTTNAALFTAANLATYDGVFLAGNAPPGSIGDYSTLLTDYVNGGGNVYLAGGTAVGGGAATEATRWNTFLGNFGLGFGSVYNGVSGNVEINSSHQLFAGVDHLYNNNGQDTFDLVAASSDQVVLVTNTAGRGLYAIYDDTAAAVPEPASLLLLGLGLAGIGLRRRATA